MHASASGARMERGCEMADVTAKQLASMAGVDGKRMRRFIRAQAAEKGSIISACGQGNRYVISAADARKLVSAFHKAYPQYAPKAPKRAPKAPKAHAPATLREAIAADLGVDPEALA